MPEYLVNLLVNNLNKVKLPVNGTSIAILGLSYKSNVADLRESPALIVKEHLEKLGANIIVYEPFLTEKSTVTSLQEAVKSAQALVVCTGHEIFVKANLEELLKTSSVKVVIDGRNIWDPKVIRSMNIVYKGIGR